MANFLGAELFNIKVNKTALYTFIRLVNVGCLIRPALLNLQYSHADALSIRSRDLITAVRLNKLAITSCFVIINQSWIIPNCIIYQDFKPLKTNKKFLWKFSLDSWIQMSNVTAFFYRSMLTTKRFVKCSMKWCYLLF